MKIIELRASNVKRIKAVDITPDGTMQVIGGRNAQGKSSVLDSIFLALGGGKAAKQTSRPIRDGEDKASVTLNLGDLAVTRTWTEAGTKLQVQSADGATHKSPQAMLDKLVGQLSFDPLAFTRLSDREQRDALLDLVELDVDLDALDAERQRAYDQRTEIGRHGKEIGEVSVDSSLPTEETSAGAILSKIREAQDHNREIENSVAAVEVTDNKIAYCKREIESLEEQLAQARERLNTEEENRRFHQKSASDRLPKRDTAELDADLETVEETNAAIRANNTARERKARKDQLRADYEAVTKTIEQFDKQKADALSAATFPVDGLAFGEGGVTYQGVPFSQASSAEQIKVSLAMGMALNPKLRVLVIKDGSLLDAEAMAAIREIVAERDFQLLIERVGDADKGAVILEDGEVRA